ncbi:MAG: ATP-binding cassette domain-containing protein [Pseudomonadota bacterium]
MALRPDRSYNDRMIEIKDLYKKYGTFEALKGISLEVGQGEIFAFLGPNGAGKTTTISILTGLTGKNGGTARLNGIDIAKDPVGAKKQFGLAPQHLNLDRELTVEENLTIHGMLHHMPRREIRRKIDELLDYVDLGDRRREFIKNLSGGLKRRVLIARALVHSPNILFLDEPTVGLDPNIRRRIWGLVKKIMADGATIFLTTHYIEEAEILAQRVGFLDEGRIVKVDTPENLMNEMGTWAVDFLRDDRLQTEFFTTRDDAVAYSRNQRDQCTVRRVNLEDAFIAMTGKKIK